MAQVTDIKVYRNGSWHSLRGSRIFRNGSWQTLSVGSGIYKNGVWYTLKPLDWTLKVLYGVTVNLGVADTLGKPWVTASLYRTEDSTTAVFLGGTQVPLDSSGMGKLSGNSQSSQSKAYDKLYVNVVNTQGSTARILVSFSLTSQDGSISASGYFKKNVANAIVEGSNFTPLSTPIGGSYSNVPLTLTINVTAY